MDRDGTERRARAYCVVNGLASYGAGSAPGDTGHFFFGSAVQLVMTFRGRVARVRGGTPDEALAIFWANIKDCVNTTGEKGETKKRTWSVNGDTSGGFSNGGGHQISRFSYEVQLFSVRPPQSWTSHPKTRKETWHLPFRATALL